jgi:hypothetical protein
MAQYLLSVWHDEDYEIDFSSPDAQRQMAQVGEFNTELIDSGVFVFANGLEPRSSAVVASPADGMLTDGPYAESKEHIGGFWVIDVPDIETARSLTSKAAIACETFVELRPFNVFDE